jgi:hypothetical protein
MRASSLGCAGRASAAIGDTREIIAQAMIRRWARRMVIFEVSDMVTDINERMSSTAADH